MGKMEITEAVIARINRFYQTGVEREKVCVYVGDPNLKLGYCNPNKPIPGPTPEIPRPKLCLIHHLCLIYMAERSGILGAKSLHYKDLLALCLNQMPEIVDGAAVEAPAPDMSLSESQTPPEPPLIAPSAHPTEPPQPPSLKPEKPHKKAAQAPENAIADDPDNRAIPFRKSSAAWKIWIMLLEPKTEAELDDQIRGKNYYYFKKFVPQVLEKARQMNVLEDIDGKHKIGGQWDTSPGRRSKSE